MNEKKKEFLIPKAEMVTLYQEDIITESAGVDGWIKDNNTEVWGDE